MSNTIANVSIKQVGSRDTFVATVTVAFDIGGPIEPDSVVQIYASPRSQSISNLVETVELTQNEHFGYKTNLTLQAGVAYLIYFCPRTVTNGILDDKIEGNDWQSFCVFFSFTTEMSSPTPPRPSALPLPPPTIDSSTTRQATLNTDGRLDIHWVSEREYDEFDVFWKDTGISGHEAIDSDRGHINFPGRDGSFGISPTFPEHIYHFSVAGIVSHTFLGIELSAEESNASNDFVVVMPPNTKSLRTFLHLSNVTLNPGLLSLGAAAISRGVRAMMKL